MIPKGSESGDLKSIVQARTNFIWRLQPGSRRTQPGKSGIGKAWPQGSPPPDHSPESLSTHESVLSVSVFALRCWMLLNNMSLCWLSPQIPVAQAKCFRTSFGTPKTSPPERTELGTVFVGLLPYHCCRFKRVHTCSNERGVDASLTQELSSAYKIHKVHHSKKEVGKSKPFRTLAEAARKGVPSARNRIHANKLAWFQQANHQFNKYDCEENMTWPKPEQQKNQS